MWRLKEYHWQQRMCTKLYQKRVNLKFIGFRGTWTLKVKRWHDLVFSCWENLSD